MKKHGVIGIEGIDTRALTIHLRDHGEMRGVVSTKDFDKDEMIEQARKYQPPEFKPEIRNSKSETSSKSKITIINLGVNKSTTAKFPEANIISYDISAEKILKDAPEQVIISSGPGDPTKAGLLIEEIKKLIGRTKLYGIQNGGLVLAQALGCTVSRMKVGHHGMNIPVVDPKTGRGEISVQNHSFMINKVPDKIEIVHVNLNDKTIEKIRTKDSSCEASLYFPIDERGKLPHGYKVV